MQSHRINRVFWPVAGAVCGFLLVALPGQCVVLTASDGRMETIVVGLGGFVAHDGVGPVGSQATVGLAWQYGLLAACTMVGAAIGLVLAALLNACWPSAPMKVAGKNDRALVGVALCAAVALTPTLVGFRQTAERVSRPCTVARGGGPDAPSILFIGNSITYFHDLPSMFALLSRSGDPSEDPRVVQIVGGGMSLEDHWKIGHAVRAIRDEGPWDYVVLQEQSDRAYHNWPEMFRYARLLDEEIKRAGAKTMIYVRPAGQDEPQAQALLDEGCARLSRDLGALIAPCGTAWAEVRRRHPKLTLHDADRGHPGPVGAYLSACVFYSVIYERSPEGLPCHLARRSLLSDETSWVDLPRGLAHDLQRTAWQTVERAKRQKR